MIGRSRRERRGSREGRSRGQLATIGRGAFHVSCINRAHGWIRTSTFPVLKRVPLPFGLRARTAGGIRTHTFSGLNGATPAIWSTAAWVRSPGIEPGNGPRVGRVRSPARSLRMQQQGVEPCASQSSGGTGLPGRPAARSQRWESNPRSRAYETPIAPCDAAITPAGIEPAPRASDARARPSSRGVVSPERIERSNQGS
jgi:hypothetical protein